MWVGSEDETSSLYSAICTLLFLKWWISLHPHYKIMNQISIGPVHNTFESLGLSEETHKLHCHTENQGYKNGVAHQLLGCLWTLIGLFLHADQCHRCFLFLSQSSHPSCHWGSSAIFFVTSVWADEDALLPFVVCLVTLFHSFTVLSTLS